MPDTTAIETAADIDTSIPEHLKTPPVIETQVKLVIGLSRDTVEALRNDGVGDVPAAMERMLRRAAEYLRTLPEDKREALSDHSAYESEYIMDESDFVGRAVSEDDVADLRIEMMGF